MSIDELIDGAKQLLGVDYDSPKAMIWKKNAKDFITSNYGKDYLRMFDRIFNVSRMSRSRQHSNEMFHEKVRRAMELLNELRSVPSKIENSEDSSSPTFQGDNTKDAIIQWLYNAQKEEPTSDIGWTKYEVVDELSDVGFEESDVSFAFDYLEDEKYFKSRTLNNRKHYRLSSRALEKILPPSDYSRTATSPTPRILNNGGVVVLGDNYGNVNIGQRIKIIATIDELDRSLLSNEDIENTDKLDIHESAETMKSQFKRPNPDISIIRSAWSTIELSPSFKQLGESARNIEQLLREFGV